MINPFERLRSDNKEVGLPTEKIEEIRKRIELEKDRIKNNHLSIIFQAATEIARQKLEKEDLSEK